MAVDEAFGGRRAAAAPVPALNVVPQSLQNFAPGLFVAPQFGHPVANGVPHSLQNFAPSSFGDAQFGQITALL
ncbi:MAG TPA: hypothetical protein VMZ33_06000 [Candidatus Limnocylindrales bacterium]|nr:hypothetical protein [Candidatus Limnocylindrales bacterium]